MDGILASRLAPGQGPTPTDFLGWLESAKPGYRATYFVGFLTVGLGADGRRLPAAEHREALHVARKAWASAERGLVHLVQRRLGDNCFEYLAIARLPRAEISSTVRELGWPVLSAGKHQHRS